LTGSGLDVISDWAISPVTIYWHAPWHSDEVTADSSNSLTLVLFSHRASYFYLLILFPCLVPTEALRLAQEVTEASCCIWSLTLTVELQDPVHPSYLQVFKLCLTIPSPPHFLTPNTTSVEWLTIHSNPGM